MAEIEGIEVKISGDSSDLVKAMNDAIAALNKLGKGLPETTKKTATLGDAFAKLRDFMQGPIAAAKMVADAIVKVAKQMDSMVMAAAEGERAIASIDSVLKATGYSAGITRDELLSFAGAMADKTLFEDEAIMQAQAVLLTFREIGKEVFPEAMDAAADMASVMGMDLQNAVVMLGKALNEPIEGVSALRRVGVQLTDDQQLLINNFIETNDLASAQAVILGELKHEFEGAAVAIASTATGSYQQFKKAIGDTNEELGRSIALILANNDTLKYWKEALTEDTSQRAFKNNIEAEMLALKNLEASLETARMTMVNNAATTAHVLPDAIRKMDFGIKREQAIAKYEAERAEASARGLREIQKGYDAVLPTLAEYEAMMEAVSKKVMTTTGKEKKEWDARWVALHRWDGAVRATEARRVAAADAAAKAQAEMTATAISETEKRIKAGQQEAEAARQASKDEAAAAKELEKAEKELAEELEKVRIEKQRLRDIAMDNGRTLTKIREEKKLYEGMSEKMRQVAEDSKGFANSITDAAKDLSVTMGYVNGLLEILGSSDELTESIAAQVEGEEALLAAAEKVKKTAEDAGDTGAADAAQADIDAINARILALKEQGEVARENAEAFNLLASAGVNIANSFASGFTDVQSVVGAISDIFKLAFKGNKELAADLQKRLGIFAETFIAAIGPLLEPIMTVLESLAPLVESLGTIFTALAPVIKFLAGVINFFAQISAWIIDAISWLITEIANWVTLGDQSNTAFPAFPTKEELFPAFAGGVRNFDGGMALVGEQGPELVQLPAGSNVYNNSETNNILGGRGGATFVFNSPRSLDPMSAMMAARAASRKMAFEGGL